MNTAGPAGPLLCMECAIMTGMHTSNEDRRIGCIFDADGTLLDSMGFWQALPQRFLESRQIAAPADISKVLADMSLPESCAYLHQQYLGELSTEDIRQEITAMIRQAYAEQITLKPGVMALLSGLQEKGIVMCVASTSDQLLLEMCFQRLGISSLPVDLKFSSPPATSFAFRVSVIFLRGVLLADNRLPSNAFM